MGNEMKLEQWFKFWSVSFLYGEIEESIICNTKDWWNNNYKANDELSKMLVFVVLISVVVAVGVYIRYRYQQCEMRSFDWLIDWKWKCLISIQVNHNISIFFFSLSLSLFCHSHLKKKKVFVLWTNYTTLTVIQTLLWTIVLRGALLFARYVCKITKVRSNNKQNVLLIIF